MYYLSTFGGKKTPHPAQCCENQTKTKTALFGWKLKEALQFCCYIVITDTFRYPLLAFLFAVIVYILRTKAHKAGDQTREGCFIGNKAHCVSFSVRKQNE